MDNNYNLDDKNDPVVEADMSDIRGVGAKQWRDAAEEWSNAARRQQEESYNAAIAERTNANKSVYDGYVQMGNAVSSRRAQYINNANAHLASALRIAAENGGRLPQYSWQGLGGALGLDGKDGAIVGGGYDKRGGFTLMVARRNQQTGQVERVPMSFSPRQQYGLMLSAPGIFSRQEVEGMRGQLINNYHMHPDQIPQVPEDYDRTTVGNRTESGGISVPGWWLYGPQRRANISAFGANGRGGFTNYESNEDTGYQLQQRDSGTRAADDKGRWKVLSRGADPKLDDGTQVTRYENDKTGEVVSVRDGETPPWESRAGGERERIARMNNETRERVQQQRGAAQRDVAQVTADATKHKADASVEVAAQNGRAKTARGGGRSDGDSSASLRRILDKSSGATDEERRKTIAMLQAREERRDRELAMSDKDRALKKADDIIDLYGGDMSGFPIKDREQIRNVVAGELYAGKEYDPDEWGSYFDNLRAQRAKNAAQNVGKAEVKTGDNGGGNERQGVNDDGLPDNAQSRKYPGFKVSTVKKAIANGYVYDEKKGGFVKPKR